MNQQKSRVESSRVCWSAFLSIPFSTIWRNLAYIIYAQIVHIQEQRVHVYNQMVKSHQPNGIQWAMARNLGHCRPLIMLSIYWNFNLNLRKIAKQFRSSLPCAHLKTDARFFAFFPSFLFNIYVRFAKCNFIYFFSSIFSSFFDSNFFFFSLFFFFAHRVWFLFNL